MDTIPEFIGNSPCHEGGHIAHGHGRGYIDSNGPAQEHVVLKIFTPSMVYSVVVSLQ